MARSQSFGSPSSFALLMASSEVDQKFLGQFAKTTDNDNPFLSAMLYKVLGLSVLLSKKLLRARKLRKLDPTRETKSLQLYHHIIWLSREGLVIVEQYILPMVDDYLGLKVLAYKLRASFYHIFVLFHNQPSVNQIAIPSFAASPSKGNTKAPAPDRPASLRTSPPTITEGGPVRHPAAPLPPGLAPVSIPKPSASFLLPALDYIPLATSSFSAAAQLSDALLPGSHPLRLSVKVEYAAFLSDCLHDAEAARKLARRAIRDVYNAQEAMDDDAFEDAAELVGVLARIMKRGAPGGEGMGGTPVRGEEGTPGGRGEVGEVAEEAAVSAPAMPGPSMRDPIRESEGGV
ncbi:hypothetical protein MMC08_004001 [Hypocenomyce scalaris]|nr:hypothetical protein [Hypocenomyce scalaris]